jgi:uncharacterized protein YdbL (DUF1318 family)
MKYLPLLLCVHCFSVRLVQVDRKTTLEQQFIGEVEDLSDDLQTNASARAAVHGLGADGDDPYARALQARRLQVFYQDDLDSARAQGCIGERNDGRVEARPCGSAASLPATDRMVQTENAAREALVAYALERDPQLAPRDRAQLWRAYHKLVLARLKAGPVQDDQGQWPK